MTAVEVVTYVEMNDVSLLCPVRSARDSAEPR
jgi:hypothetical protein